MKSAPRPRRGALRWGVIQRTLALLVVGLSAALVPLACSSGPATTADGGTIYTSPPPDGIPCTTDTDCCVLTDTCRSAAYVVHAGDAIQMPQTACNACIVPAVQVWCKNGTCQSGELKNIDPNAAAAFEQDHCGTLPIPADAGDTSLYGPDGGLTTMAAYGCAP
jgi:hypothetical protein